MILSVTGYYYLLHIATTFSWKTKRSPPSRYPCDWIGAWQAIYLAFTVSQRFLYQKYSKQLSSFPRASVLKCFGHKSPKPFWHIDHAETLVFSAKFEQFRRGCLHDRATNSSTALGLLTRICSSKLDAAMFTPPCAYSRQNHPAA